jgi:mannosyltransferase
MLRLIPRPAAPDPAARAVAGAGRQRARGAARGLVWGVPAVVAAVLGAQNVGVPLLWRDELATWSAASRTVPQLWTMVRHIDAVLGLYYLVIHLWMGAFGDSATALRVPSVLAMTAAACVVALTGKRLGGATAGIVSGLVFAVIPSVSRFAQEARPYAFATLFAALATLLLLRALERPSWPRWTLYGLAVALAGAWNLVALCMLTGHAIWVAGASLPGAVRPGGVAAGGGRRAVLTGFCLSALAGVALDGPIIVAGQSQALTQIGHLQRPSAWQLIGASGGLWPQLFCSTAVAIAVVVLAVTSLAWPDRRVAGCALGTALLPILVVWAASQGPSSYWSTRYLMFTVPAWAVAAGLSATAVNVRRLRRLRIALAIVPAAAVGLLGLHDHQVIRQPEAHNWWMYPARVGSGPADYQGAAEVISANERPGDGIVFQIGDQNHWQVDTGIAYYLADGAVPTAVFQLQTPAQAGGLEPRECIQRAQCLPDLRGRPRLWVVYVNRLVHGNYRNPYSAIPPAQAAALHAARYQTRAWYEEDGITVALLTPR